MDTLKKTLIFCAAFIALVLVYVEDCATQHLVKTKESHVIKTLEPKLTFEYIKKNRRNSNFVILDIRTPQEFQSGYIEGAINIDYYSPAFPTDLNKLEKSKTYFIYCRTGRRTADAIRIMTQKGFKNIYRTSGDIVAWRAAGLPLVKGAKSTRITANPAFCFYGVENYQDSHMDLLGRQEEATNKIPIQLLGGRA
jgi:rhodanese-related sulfurtransferase